MPWRIAARREDKQPPVLTCLTVGIFSNVAGLLLLLLMGWTAGAQTRARDLGVRPGVLEPGPINAITDVAGVRVGHVTLIEGESVRTGVTAILRTAGICSSRKYRAQSLWAMVSESSRAARR